MRRAIIGFVVLAAAFYLFGYDCGLAGNGDAPAGTGSDTTRSSDTAVDPQGPLPKLGRFPDEVKDLDSYFARYPYMSYRGTALTFGTEFEWPQGFRRIDSAKLTPFQYWVSFVPLWNPLRPVGSLRSGVLYTAEQVARPIDLSWRTTRFFDHIIPLQLLAEYYIALVSPFEYAVDPKVGAPLRYQDYLQGRAVFTVDDSLFFRPGD